MGTSQPTQRRTKLPMHHSVVVVSTASVLLVEPAWAYLDPGTGWMIVQGFIATIAAAGVAVGTYWTRIKLWFSSRHSKPGDDVSPSGEQEPK